MIFGKVKVYYYDLDKKLICTKIIKAGDISVTLYGGHNYKALSENTLVYEYKSGPYQGIENDKKFID